MAPEEEVVDERSLTTIQNVLYFFLWEGTSAKAKIKMTKENIVNKPELVG